MEIECDLASIRDEDLLRKMWQQSEDFGRKKEIRSHLYKLRESRLREFYSTGGPGGDIIMNPATDMHFGKAPLTPSHGDSLVDQSFQSLKSKEVRDSLSPSREIKFRNSGGVAGGVLVPDTTGWDVQTSSEVSPDGRAFRTETKAKTDGVEKIPGGHSEFAGRNEQKSSASHQGDDKNYVKKAAESSKTHLQEKVVIGDENSGRTEMKSSSVTSSSKVVSSSSQQVISSGDPGFDMEPRRLMAHDQQYQNELQAANTSTSHSERQQFSRNERNERNETSSNVREESKKYVDMDKASPEYQQHVQYLMSQPGAIVSNTVEYPKPGVKMITTVKKLPDGTTVKTKRYETEAGADSTSISQTMKQQQQQQRTTSSTTSQKTTEKRIQDSEDVFTRLARTRDSNVPAGPRNAPETPSTEDVYSRLQQSRGVNDQKFSDSIDQRSTQVLRDSNQHPGSRNAPGRRPSNLPDNVEMISTTNKTVKKDLNQSVRSEKITSSDFIQNERDRYVLDHESPSRRGPDGYPDALAPITPSHHARPHPHDDYPSNGYPASSEVIKQSSTSKTSAKFSESRRFSTETVESYQHSENENQDYTTRGYPSNRRPIEEPKGRSPSSGRPAQDFSTHGFPSVRSDKPTQQYSSDRPSSQDQDDYTTTERVHVIHTDRSRPGDVNQPDSSTTTRSNYSTNETRRHVTSTKEDFSTHGFPSVRAGTPTGDSPRRPLGSDPTPSDSPRRPSGQEPPVHQARKPPSDGFSTHGFPSVKSGSPTEDSPRRPSGPEPTNQGRRPTTGRSTPTQSAPQYESSPRVDRDDTTSVTSDRSNSITYEKRIDAAHQAFARSLRCASPVESVRRDSTSDRHTPRSSIGSIRNTYSPSKRDGRSPSHDSITNSESSRISSGTVTKSHKPTEVRRVSGPKSPIGKSAPSHVSNETIDLSLTRKITPKPSPEKTTGRPTTVKEEPSASAEPILRKKIFGATENFLASEAIVEKPILKKEKYYQLGLSDATLPSSHSKARHQLGTTPNTSRRPIDTEEEVNTLLGTATKHITTHPSPVTPTTRSAKNQDTKPSKPETLYSKKAITKPEGYITQTKANEINEKHNQTTNKHVSYPHYIPSAPKADRSPSDKPTTNNFSSPAPTTTTSTTPHNAPKSTKDKVKPSSTSPTTTKPFSSPSKVDNTTPRFTKTVKVENAINRDTTTKTRRHPKPDSESEPLPEPEDLDEGYVPDRKGTRKPNSQRPTSDDEGFEPDSPRAGSPTSDFEYRRPEQIETYDEEDSFLKKTRRTDKKTVTNDFLTTERDVKKPLKTEDRPSNLIDEPRKPRDRKVGEQDKPEDSYPKHPKEGDSKPSHSTVPKDRDRPEDQEPKRPSRRPKGTETEPTWSFDEPNQSGPNERNQEPSPVTDEPRSKASPNEPRRPNEDNRVPSYSDDKPSKTTDSPRPRGTKPPLERSETFEERCRQILGMETDTVVDRTKKTQEFIETERTTVDSKRKPSGRSPSPEKNQPSDTVSIEDCDDDDSGAPRKHPTGRTSTTTTTFKTTHDHPRDKSPSKKGSDSRPEEQKTDGYPRDRSPTGKVPKGTRPNELDERTTVVTTTKTTDRRATSPNRKTPESPSNFDDSRPRDHSPSEETVWIDETSTIRRKAKIVDENDERTTRSKPGSRPRDQAPQGTRPITRSPANDSDTDDNLASTRPRGASPSEKRTFITTRETTFEIDSPRDKSPSRKPVRERSPTDESPRGKAPSKKPVRGTSPTDESPRDKSPIKKPVRGTSPTDETIKSSTATMHSTITDGITEDRYPSYTPKSYPREHSPSDKQKTRPRTTTDEFPRDKSPSQKPVRETSPIDESPREKSPSRKPARGTSPIDESPREKSPFRKPVRGTSPSDKSPRDKTPSKKPTSPSNEIVISSTTTVHSTTTDGINEDRYPSYTPKSYPRDRSPSDNQNIKPRTTTDKIPRDKSPSQKPVRDTSPTNESPREKAPSKKPVRGTSPTDEFPRDKAPSKKPVRDTSPTDEFPRDKAPSKKPVRGTSPTDETITSSTTTMHSTTTDGVHEDRYPSYTPKSYPRDRSPSEPQKSRPRTTEEEELLIKTKKTTKKTSAEEILDDVFEVTRPRERSPDQKPHGPRPDTSDGSFLSHISRDISPSETVGRPANDDSPPFRPKDYPRDRSPQKPSTKETEESFINRTTKTIKETTIDSENTDRIPSSHPRDRSPNEKFNRPVTEETDEYQRTVKTSRNTTLDKETADLTPNSHPRGYPRDSSPVDDLTHPRSKEITETRRTDKKTVINEFLDTERGIDKPQRPKDDKPINDRTPERLTSSRPRDYPTTESPNQKPKRPTTDESITTRTTKTTKDTTIVNEMDQLMPSSRPRDRSPNEKPIRSPRIVTTETTTEYGISERPRSQSPSEKTRKPVDSEEIDETILQKTTKFTKDTTTKSDLIVDVEKPSRRPRPAKTQDQPLAKTPEKPKETRPSHPVGETPRDRSPLGKPKQSSRPSDRSPSPRSKQPKEQRPTPGDTSPRRRSPVGKEKKPTGSPRQSSPSEKPRNYQLTEEEIRVAQKLKSTKVTTTSKDITEVEFEDRPRDRSPSEKPRSSRPVINDGSPRDLPRQLSPSKKPEDHEQTDSEYEETIVTKTNKRTRDENTLEQKTVQSPKTYPREKSPSSKPRGSMPTEGTITTTTVIEERFPKGRRGTSPAEKPNSRDYPRDMSPTERPRKPKQNGETSPSEQSGPRDRPREKSPNDRPRRQELNERTVLEKTSIKTTATDDRLPKSPRQTSPSGKPRGSPRDRSPTDKPRKPVEDRSPTGPRRALPKEKPDDILVQKTTRGRKTVKETDHFVDECCQEHHPTEKSPSRKPKDSKPSSEIVVQRKIKTTTVEDGLSKTPRSTSPTKTSPRGKSPTQKPTTVYSRSPKESPRKASPSEKPSRHQPVVKEFEQISKFSKDRITSEKTILQDRIRKSPSEKPKRRPSSDEETDDETTETIIAVYTIDGETVETHPRDHSPSRKSKSYPTKPSENSPKRPQSNGPERPRGTSPSEKPKGREPIDEEVEETFTQRTSKITKQEEIDIEDEIVKNRSPRDRLPEKSPRDRSRDDSPTETSSPRSYPRDTSPQKPNDEVIDETVIVTKTRKTPCDDQYPSDSTKQPRNKSPSETPRGPRQTEDTILFTTTMTKKIGDHPRDRSPTGKPRDRSPTEKASTRTHPRDRSPLDKQSRPKPGKVEETTNRSVTSKKIVQETDFEKRFPKGRPGDQSPNEKPSTLRRPSKISATMTTTTTRNRSTLDEEDINRTQRPRTQPSTRDKIPTKSTPLSSPRTQSTIDRRVPAELPSPGRKPKSTFGVATKTTTVTKTQTSRPKPTMEAPKKPSKLPLESRPSARAPERKLSPSISPDSSPSRPASEVEVESPYRSPNMSPSRKSPSPTRSVKLEDITSSVDETKKTITVTIDKSKPKTTHVTTAKFQVTPPESPTKSSPPSKKPSSKVPTTKTTGSRYTTDTTTIKKITKDVPTDSERDSEIPSDAEEVDTPLPQKPSTRKLPVTERKESAPVHRVTKVNKDVQMSRSTSENIIKTPIAKRPVKHEPLEPIHQREATRPVVGDRSSPKTERRPSKHLSTKTINLTTFDKLINSQDMENVVIDIQHAKSSREQSPNKIVPTPVSIDVYTGKPRYPDVVTEPEDEPKKKPNVKNIPIFEEETNDFVGCQITEINEDTLDHNTTRTRTTKFIERESSPQRRTPRIITSDNVDNECLLSVHDKVSKFISTAEEVSKPKTSAPFRRDVPEEDMPEDDECLLTVDEKVSKFLKTADSVTKEVITSKPRRVERPSIEDMDEELRTDECVLSVSEKVNKFTTKAEKLAPSAPQRSPELVARIERQISRQSDVESESPECEDSPASVRKFKPTAPLVEKNEIKYTERQIDILSRPSVWDKKPKPDVKLDDIFGYKPEDEPESDKGVPKRVAPTKTHPDDGKSKPIKPIDSVSKRKELFENKVSTNKTTVNTKRSSPESRPIEPTKAPLRRPSDQSDSRYPNEFTPRYVDGYPPNETDDDVHEDVYGSSKTRRVHETSRQETKTVHRSPERSPTRKSSHPEIRPTSQTPTRSTRQPEENTPSRRYSEDHSPRYTKDQPQTDRYMETRENSEHTTRRRSSTQEYPERRTPNNGSLSPRRKQPVEEPEDYTFSSKRGETNRHSTTRTAPRSPKDIPLNQTSFPDDEDLDHSPARSTSTVSSHRQTTHRTTSTRLTEDISSRRPRRPSGNEPSTPTTGGRTPRARAVPETVAARRNIFEKSPGDISPMPSNRRPSYMEPTKSSLEHRKDSIEITKTNFSRKSSVDEEPYEPSPKASVKFGVGLKHKEEPKPKRKLSSSDIPNIEDVFELELLEEMLNIVTLYEQRRRIRAQIRVVKKLLETKTKEEVSRMTKISTIRKTSSSFVRESPTPRKETTMRPERYQPSDDIDSESTVKSRHIEEHEEIIRERSISPKSKTSRVVTKVTETRRNGESSTPKRTPQKKDEPKDSKPIWATKNILKKPSENEKVTRALSAKKTTSTSSSSMSRTQQTHHQRLTTDDDCVTSSYGIGPTDEDGRPLFGIRALKKKTTTNNTAQPSETTKVTGTVITEKYYSENGAEPIGERKVTVYSTNPEDLVDMETQYDRRDSETVKREKLSKDGLTTVTKVQKIGKYKPGEIPSLTDDAEFTKATSKMVRRGSVKEMSEKFIRKESSSSVTEKSSGYPKAGLILRTRTNSGATADTADQYEVRAKSTEYDYDSEDEVEIRTSRKHSKVVTESDDETEIRRKVNTRSFLNSGGSKVTGIDDVLDRMRNADNVVVDGDTMEDREARSLLNKFLGASVLMTGMESMIPQKELRRTTAGADSKQEVKTTRVTKTIKTGATGGRSSSSPVARETCDIEEIWDEEILKQLLEKSTSYEERRSIRARLRQLMAEREACAELKAGSKAELNETKVQTSKKSTQVADDESSGSEYEEIIEEYTASEDDDEDDKTPTTTTVVAEKKKDEVKEEKNIKKITEEVKKTTITKKEEPKSVETKKNIVVETTTVIEEEDAAPSSIEEKKQKVEDKNNNDDDDNDNSGDSASVSDSKGESLLIPLLQGLLHKNMPQARSSSGSSSKIATISATTSNKNSNNLKSSLKANNTHFSSTSNSNNNNSLGDSGLSSEVSKNSSLALGQKQSGSSLRVTAPQQIEDSGTESGEDLRLIAAGIRDSMQIEGIENHSDMSLIKEVTNALNKLESSLKEGKDLALDNSKKSTLLALVERLQTGLTAPDKLSSAVAEQDFPDETSSPEADNHRSNRQRFAKRKNRNNRHTVGVSKEELADARRYIEEMVMIENLSNCTTPECNAATTPPELFAIQKQQSAGAIISSSHEPKEASGGLFRPNQFVPNNLKHSTEAGSAHPDVQMRQKKGTPGPGQRQSTGDMDSMKVPNSESNNGKRPLSDSFDSYTAQSNRVTFSDSKPQNGNSVQERNQYNRSYHSDDKPNNLGRLSPDSNRLNRFNNKKQLMKRANTIDIPKTHRYNPEFDTDSDFEDRNALNSKGLRGTVQVTVKRKPRQVVPNFEPKTENDHKFLAFIQKQSNTTGLGWNSSKSVSNWTNKFGNIKNVFESGANVSNSNGHKNSAPQANSSAKNFWKKSEEKNPPKISNSVLTSALKAKELNEKRGEVVVPKPIHMNKFSHNPQSAFRPVDISPETIQMQFKPIPMEKPANVSALSPTKAYNPVRRQALESPHYAQSSPTKSWIKKNTATNSPVTLPWTVKPPENNVLKIAATKFESHSPVQRHQSFKQQEKRPSLPNAAYPYQYQDDGYTQSQHSYVSNSQPVSYAEYPQQPRIFRESSLTNPQAEPLVLTPNKPAYSPHSLQPFEYYNDDLNQHALQTDMTDDDIDDMESMTEYRVEAKVMGKPMSQQAVTVGKRTSHMSDDEVFGKNSRAAKSLLSVMKNIGNGNNDKTSKKVDRKQAPVACKSPNGSAYIAPIVEPLFPEVTKFEANRDPEYIGKQHKHAQQAVDYQQNPVYVPLEDYQQKQPPVAPPRGRKVSQDRKKGSAYLPQERPNVYQQPRRDAPSSLPVQAGPTSPPRYLYSSPSQTPDSAPSTAQVLNEGMYMQNVPAFRKPYSEPNTPSDYSATNEAYFNQYGQMQKSYQGPQAPVILPQIPLETSYTKVYDQPRDVSSFYQPPMEQSTPGYNNLAPKVQQSAQPSIYGPSEYQQKSDIPNQYYQTPKVQQSPLSQGFAPQQAYQPRAEYPAEYYQSPKVQQSPQQLAFTPQQTYQPRVEVPPEYYNPPKPHQILQPQVMGNQPITPSQVPVTFYQSPQIQPSAQPPMYAPHYADASVQYNQSPKIQQSPRPDNSASYFQSPKFQQIPQPSDIPLQYQQQSPKIPQTQPHPQGQHQPYKSPVIQQGPHQPQPSEVPLQYQQQSPNIPQGPYQNYKSPVIQQSPQPQPSEVPVQYQQQSQKLQTQPLAPQQDYKSPVIQQSLQSQAAPSHKYESQQTISQSYQSSKTQQSPQPMSPPYKPKAPLIQSKPQKNESVTQSSKSQHSSSTYLQQQMQSIVASTKTGEQQIPNAAVLCKQASLEGRKRVQSQSQKYEEVEEIRRKSLGNVLEVTRVERESREQKAAAIKQDMYSVQQDVYSQQKSMQQKTEVHQQETKVVYKSSAPDDTPDIVKSSLKKDDIPILKKFGPPQRHCYIPNAYQNPLKKSETTVMTPKIVSRKFSDPAVTRGPVIVEIPSTPQPDSQDEIPRNIVFNNVSAFTSMSRRQGETSMEYTSQQSRPNKLSKCDSWHQICQLQNIPKPPSPRFNTSGSALRRSKSGHTLALPKLYEASYDRAEISEKQKTVAAYFGGQKSPNSLSRNSSQTNLADESNYVSVKKSSINRIRTSEKASISRQDPSSGLSRSHTMPQIANVNLLDESNVEDAFEQLMNGLSTTTTEKTQTKNEDGGVVTTTTKVTTRTISGAPKPVSPFAKFQQLDKQSSLQSPKSPLTPTTPGGSSSTPIFRFTDPALNARAATFKEQLLQWCQSKTQEYENVQITNFSASWTDGLAFCALIHHFLPDAFDYSKLNPKQRRYNFELAFRVADEKAGIAPLLDVEDMVVMKRPDWKCVFTYVQSIYRRFRNCQ